MHLFPSPFRFKESRAGILLTIGIVILAGCHSRSAPPKASLEITQLPAANAGGPVQLGFIEGRANNAAPGQQIVIYAYSGIWWIQPFANQPFTRIQPDSTWRNSTHLGTEYAAVLVEQGYRPASKIATLPAEGGGVIAVARMKGKIASPVVSKVLHFSGYDWNVRTAGSDRGGEPNAYDSENAWVDHNGYLHLHMQERAGRWTCAEVSMTRSLGYGSYMFMVQDSGHLSPSVVLGLYTMDDLRTDDVRSELDVELSRWGSPANKNAQFVVQPFYVPENISRFEAPAGALTHMFRWEPGRASFKTARGSGLGQRAVTVSEHVFTSGIPVPGNETPHIDLYDFHHSRGSSQQPAEVVVEKFEFLP
jgi:hypothetical protein